MSPFRYRDEDSSSTGTVAGVVAGALAGFAVGMLVAQKVGGFGALSARIRRRAAEFAPTGHQWEVPDDEDELEDYEADDIELDDFDASLEERVLEAFRNDPVLSERAVDIGSVGDGMIELAGWVETDAEAQHAVTVARGVPDVDTVVNRMAVGSDERRMDEAARRVEAGDPALTTSRWETNIVGTGKRRQGTSAEIDRHSDPRVTLEERWSGEAEAVRNAADDMDGIAERRRSTKSRPRGDRTGGSPVAPTGVPKADHVANPPQADRHQSRVDVAGETGGNMTDDTGKTT